MKLFFSTLFVLTGIGLLVACKQPALDNSPSDSANTYDTTRKAPKYRELGMNDYVGLPGELDDSIQKLIPICDAGFGLPGRTNMDALDMNIVGHTLSKAAVEGGHAVGVTYFDDFWYDDRISIAIETAYDQNTLVLRAHEDGQRNYYTANVKITYRVIVDGNSREGTYYDSTSIQSNLPLLEQP